MKLQVIGYHELWAVGRSLEVFIPSARKNCTIDGICSLERRLSGHTTSMIIVADQEKPAHERV
jgi:hypothetical protein